MFNSRPKPKPTFLGQGLLIVLPVLVLAGVGLYSLRQDSLLAHVDAAERANQMAETLLPQLWGSLNSDKSEPQLGGSHSIQVDLASRLIFPAQVAPWPVPKPYSISLLNDEQASLWRMAQACDPGKPVEAATLHRRFLSLLPPKHFTAGATYSLASILATQGDTLAASELFKALIIEHPEAVGESGFPLQPLAQLKLLALETHQPDADRIAVLTSLCSNIVFRPTPLTPMLLQAASNSTRITGAAELAKWTDAWQEHERARQLYSAARQHADSLNPEGPRLFWFSATNGSATAPRRQPGPGSGAPAEQWLAVRYQQNSTSSWFSCRSEFDVADELYAVAKRAAPMPDYFGIELELAGRRLLSRTGGADQRIGKAPSQPPGNSGPWPADADPSPELLGSARRFDDGKEWLRVSVYVTKAATLYSRQSSRRFWFGSLVAIAAAAALTGLLAAWRAFKNQQQLSELKSNFVSSVSHELRAPVASVGLLAETLEDGSISDSCKQREFVRLIRQECRRLSALVENLLDFSRIEQGRKEYEFEPTDVVALVEQTMKGMERYAQQRQISLTHVQSASRPSSRHSQPLVDGPAIQQALVNLIDNAIKHSPEGGTVTIGLDWRDRNRDTCDPDLATSLAIWVRDCGGGIPREEQAKIFERFYRRGSELRRETHGIGIGLTIVKHIVEGHRGRIIVESAVGRGSLFTIQLPLDRNSESATQ